MLTVFIINTIIGCLLFAISITCASRVYCFLFSLFGTAQSYFFFPTLIISIGCFFLSFILCSIVACRIIVATIKNKTGVFPNTSIPVLLRVTSDVLTSHLCGPLYPSLPFLVNLQGAKTGKNFIFTGKIFNADLLEAGDNVLVGEEALLSGHLQQKNKMFLNKIIIGNNVVIGGRSLIMPDVIIGDNSIIAIYSVIPMGTRIPPDEIWGGNPVKKIRDRKKE